MNDKNTDLADIEIPVSETKSTCTDTSCCPPKTPTRRTMPKVGRNDPCICGNGRKFKKCCGKNV